jgi:alanine racemase
VALRALARVNVAALERNVARLAARLASGTSFCAVVKANGYGHGAAAAARAALAAGARMLAVATAGEAAELRQQGIEAPLLVMGALSDEELPLALAARAELVAWTTEFVRAVASAEGGVGTDALGGARTAGSTSQARVPAPVRMHVKLDTGMGRLGTREAREARAVAEAILSEPRLELAGAMTHLATADQPDPSFMREQLARFVPFARELRQLSPSVIAHAANSAATLREPAAHHQMVRCGVAIYGLDPMNVDPAAHGLEPALELESYVAAVKLARAGESAGYGRRFIAERDTWLATVPIGYGDGVPRALSNVGEVLIGGRRHRIAGVVSMDNITVELGPQPLARVGERAVLIGAEGGGRLLCEEQARSAGTINYELVCRISARVPRLYHRDGEALPR